jgi:hypothetical protein
MEERWIGKMKVIKISLFQVMSANWAVVRPFKPIFKARPMIYVTALQFLNNLFLHKTFDAYCACFCAFLHNQSLYFQLRSLEWGNFYGYWWHCKQQRIINIIITLLRHLLSYFSEMVILILNVNSMSYSNHWILVGTLF